VLANLHFLDTVREYAHRVIGLKQGAVIFDSGVSNLSESVVRELYYDPAALDLSRPSLELAS
jgi:phosphonate transport system ATP-binding protein